ncbi:MAG: zinc ribbon domain-containing protein [Actinomycetota bacterium]|nr:zinc ribbon domain-containing protein [Actinomycetota bacterium]
MKTCHNCNAANDDAARFCGLCLEKFLETGAETASTASPADSAAPGQVGPTAEPYDARYVEVAPESFFTGKQKSILLSSTDLLSNAFSFFMDNMKFYILLSIVVSALILLTAFTIGGATVSSVMPAITGRQTSPESMARLSSSFIWNFLALGALVGFLALLGQFSVMVATTEMSKGYELSVFAVIFEALKKSGSFIWITGLQFILAGGAILAGIVLTAALRGASAAPAVIGMIIGIPVAVVVGTWFSLAAFVYLDTDTRGLAALAASKELIGARWPNVCWRFFVFGAAIAVLNAIPVIGWLIGSFVVTPLSAIFPWMLYRNLKQLALAPHSY